MIRPSDLASTALWPRPAASSPRADTREASSLFELDASMSSARISSDLCADARGLSVDRHAARVLSHLCAESNEAI